MSGPGTAAYNQRTVGHLTLLVPANTAAKPHVGAEEAARLIDEGSILARMDAIEAQGEYLSRLRDQGVEVDEKQFQSLAYERAEVQRRLKALRAQSAPRLAAVVIPDPRREASVQLPSASAEAPSMQEAPTSLEEKLARLASLAAEFASLGHEVAADMRSLAGGTYEAALPAMDQAADIAAKVGGVTDEFATQSSLLLDAFDRPHF